MRRVAKFCRQAAGSRPRPAYAIAAARAASLKALLDANRERISFVPDQLTADQIRAKLANGDFVELADVPDLVWKRVATRVPGGRDVVTNTGPEHPNHYADSIPTPMTALQA